MKVEDQPEWTDDDPIESLPAVREETSALIDVDKARVSQEVQVKIWTAKQFPRDTVKAHTKMIVECKRISLAKLAMYAFPRGGQLVTGPTVRLAEAAARSFGNLDYGWEEIERRRGSSVCATWCWDMENNVVSRMKFEVPHEIGLKGNRIKKLTDPRDIYELCANQAMRRLRKCILEIIPGDFTDSAVAQCKKTLAAGDGKESLADRVKKMVLAFMDLGVTQAMIEERIKHGADLTQPDELVDLLNIYNALKEGSAKRSDFFNFPEDKVAGGKAAEFRDFITNPEGGNNGNDESI